MLITLCTSQHDAYLTEFEHFATESATGEVTLRDMKGVIEELLRQQREIILFQVFLSNFQYFIGTLKIGKGARIE
jgi:hypothetical protein